LASKTASRELLQFLLIVALLACDPGAGKLSAATPFEVETIVRGLDGASLPVRIVDFRN
jgi:hypothetical protein